MPRRPAQGRVSPMLRASVRTPALSALVGVRVRVPGVCQPNPFEPAPFAFRNGQQPGVGQSVNRAKQSNPPRLCRGQFPEPRRRVSRPMFAVGLVVPHFPRPPGTRLRPCADRVAAFRQFEQNHFSQVVAAHRRPLSDVCSQRKSVLILDWSIDSLNESRCPLCNCRSNSKSSSWRSSTRSPIAN
jgi:hypothetical protein